MLKRGKAEAAARELEQGLMRGAPIKIASSEIDGALAEAHP
jgi:hypothetical protein